MLNYQPFFNRKFILPKVDKIFAVSQASKNRLLKDGIPEEKIDILPNFIDEEKFYYNQEEKQLVRKQLNINPDETVITFIGKVDRGKGIYDYVEVCKELNKTFKNLKFLIIGDGRDLKPALEKFKSYSLENRVITTGNVINPNWYLKASDVVMVLSKGEESFGRTVIESFAVKSLVVVYDIENLKYLVENYKTGLVVEKDNINKVVNTLKQVLANQDLYNTITENAYQEFLQKYTKKRVLQDFLNKLKALL